MHSSDNKSSVFQLGFPALLSNFKETNSVNSVKDKQEAMRNFYLRNIRKKKREEGRKERNKVKKKRRKEEP